MIETICKNDMLMLIFENMNTLMDTRIACKCEMFFGPSIANIWTGQVYLLFTIKPILLL